MADLPRISFDKLAVPSAGTLVVFADDQLRLGATASAFDEAGGGLVAKAAKIAAFKGKSGSVLEILAPAGGDLARLIVIGVGKAADMTENDWIKAGGTIAGRAIAATAGPATILAETSAGPASADDAANIALGVRLGAYTYDKYKTKKGDDTEAKPGKVSIATAQTAAAKRAYARREAIADGVALARDLVNAPPNDLGPVEFAKACENLGELGVAVEVLTEKEMRKLGMGALLGVAQGSVRPPRLAIMRWNGGKQGAAPLALVGKGVVFDTGGISIKPAQGMEDMKGDMAGAAAVVGAMHALAARKAKANVVGIVGLVENMPDGNAQRPGDIVKSMSGQTVEIVNTDAEGRLVLADALWYCKDKFAPAAMVNLATLTGAIMVALGSEHAGLFSNDDTLSERLLGAGKATGEKLWRMPLAPEYDKIIDSRFADMKNSAGRNAGAITAAQFLKRFVGDVPWAHIDLAGTTFGTNNSEINKSWGTGYGVRLLDRLVADHYE